MIDRRLERWFVRFRDRGDAAALTRVFDRVAPDLLALASHLLQEPNAAEDVLQTTFLKAIEHADRFDARRRLYPWLVGILTREARQHQRREARRFDVAEHEVKYAPEASQAAQSAELSAALTRAIAELPSSCRDIVRAYLHEGLRPREIALEHGIAPGTVRVRIHRGLDRLRKRLPASLALGALAALTPTRGLAAVRSRVLAAAQTAAVPQSATATAIGVSTWACASALIVVAVGAVAWRSSRPAPVRVAAAAAEGLAAPVSRAVEVMAEPERESTPSGGGGAKLPGSGPSDERRVALPPAAPIEPAEEDASLVHVRGHVVVPAGYPVEEVKVALHEVRRQQPAGTPELVWGLALHSSVVAADARCDEEGAFELELERARTGVLVVFADSLQPQSLDVELETDVELGTIALTHGATIEGRAFFGGRPLGEGSPVFASPSGTVASYGEGVERISVEGRPYAHRLVEAETDAEGRFVLAGLHATEYLVTPVPADVGGNSHYYEAMPDDGVLVRAPAVGVEIHSALRPLKVLVLRGLKPARFAIVSRRDGDGDPFPTDDPVQGLFAKGARTGSDGIARLFVHPEMPMRLLVKAPGAIEREVEIDPSKLPLDGVVQVTLELDGEADTLQLSFTNAREAAIEGRRVHLQMFSFEYFFASLEPVVVAGGTALFSDPIEESPFALLSFERDLSRPPDQQPYAYDQRIELGGQDAADESGEARKVEVELGLGGRICLHVDGYRAGDPLPEFALRSEEEQEHELEYLVRAPNGGSMESAEFVPGQPNWSTLLLSPGKYVLIQRSAVYASEELELSLVAGRTVDAYVRLQRAH